ncbi:MAG: 3'-5' exonuclease [Parerythrobacter sp.]
MNTITEDTGGSAVGRLTSGENDQCISLWRVRPFDRWPKLVDPVEPIRTIAVLDTETTGLDPDRDKVIEIAVAFAKVDAMGRIMLVPSAGEARQSPGFPLSPEITQLTGLIDEMLAGQTINTSHIAKRLNEVEAIFSHNAFFDRPFVERLMPELKDKPWVCTMNDADWAGWGFDGRKQDHLLMQSGLFNPVKHRAMSDVISLVNLLDVETPTGGSVLAECMDRAKLPTWRFEARGLPYDFKNVVKERGWRWGAKAKVWWTEVADADRKAEEAWYANAFRPFRDPPHIERVTWETRYKR